ncbi:MAG: HDOD domain-containing protein [Bryobacteraceae bacterium]|nr:HDOD domain-containing protein [Bryobacteraceae bacterium]
MKSLDQLPPFSPVMNSLVASLAEEDVSFAHLASVIERDSVLAGNVLRLVNSALYGRRGTVSSVRAAVSMLGLTKLRNYVLGLSVARIWARAATPPDWEMERFNRHGTAVGVLADLIVQKGRFDYPEGAFAAGLLHDLGRLMVAISLPEEHERISQAYAQSSEPLETHVQAVLDVTHAELSSLALQRWSIPQPIQRAVLYHQRGDGGQGISMAGQHPLSLALRAADQIANHRELGIHPLDGRFGLSPVEALAALGLDAHAGQVMEEFEIDYAALRETL